MSMDPRYWQSFEQLSDGVQENIRTLYPYLKLEQCEFQEKTSGVFMRLANSVKVEKLLDPQATLSRKPGAQKTNHTKPSVPAHSNESLDEER